MNLNVLSSEAMLGVSAEWLQNEELRRELEEHLLGKGVCAEIAKAHGHMAHQSRLRGEIERRIATLSTVLTSNYAIHGRKARALHLGLQALVVASDDPERTDRIEQLQRLLFPEELRIVTRPYMHVAGAAVALEQRVSADELRALEALRLGQESLADIYRDWVAAGKAIGKALHERSRLRASISRKGAQADKSNPRQARLRWIRAVRLMLDSLDLMPLSERGRELLLAPLVQFVKAAERRRANVEPGDEPELPGAAEHDATGSESAPGDLAGREHEPSMFAREHRAPRILDSGQAHGDASVDYLFHRAITIKGPD